MNTPHNKIGLLQFQGKAFAEGNIDGSADGSQKHNLQDCWSQISGSFRNEKMSTEMLLI